MESDQIALHVMSLISKEMGDGFSLIESCHRANDRIKVLMPSMYESASRDMVNQALNLMVELGRINECPNWE